MSGSDAKKQWVSRVLGVTVPDASTPSTDNGGSDQPRTLPLVRLGRARLQWMDARQRALDGVTALKGEIAEEFADRPDQQQQLAQALATLGNKLDELGPRLEEQLDQMLNARTPNEQGDLAKTVRTTLQRFMAYVDSDPIIGALDGNEVLPSMMVTAPMRAALSQIAKALA